MGRAWFVRVALMSADGAALSSSAARAAGSDGREGGLVDVSMLCWRLCGVVSYAWILKAWWRRLQ